MTLRAASLEKQSYHVDFLHIYSIALFIYLFIFEEKSPPAQDP